MTTSWRFTGFYESPVEHLRKESWNKIQSLSSGNQMSWLIMGDFNEIMYSFEKKGGRIRDKRQMSAFHEVLKECELCYIGFSG